jgi:protein-disulfide isomerase
MLLVISGATCSAPSDTELNAILAIGSGDHVLAVGDPKVTVIEYTDFQCSYCRRFELETFPTIKRDYIDTGKVRWVFRHFPLTQIHANAEAAAEASECAADQGKFWEYVDLAFQNQSALSNNDLKAYASQLGLDTAAFDACLDGGSKAAHVQSDLAGGTAIPIPGTPTFFINGEMVIGFKFPDDFADLLDAALAAAGG